MSVKEILRAEIYQWRWRSECNPSLSVISAAFMAFGRSCLLANTRRTASRNSSYKQGIPLINDQLESKMHHTAFTSCEAKKFSSDS
jgi:hypothetical protein